MLSYEEALDWLYQQKKSKKREDLSRIEKCIDLLGIKVNYKIIHIAGTNGKGSTANLLYQLLLSRGKSTGLFVSPYVISFNERIEANGSYITNYEVFEWIQYLKEFSLTYQARYNDTIPFFELTFLMALLFYEKKKIEYLVLECGLGGRLDATNVLEKNMSIITNIGMDHMAQLGNTLEEIASHKLGITRENVICLTTVDENIRPYFETYGKEHNVPILFLKEHVQNIRLEGQRTIFTLDGIEYQTSLQGLFQAYNASLAIQAIRYFEPSISYEELNRVLNNAFWPGRFEQIEDNILLDGAHNIPGIEALCSSILTLYPNRKIKVVFTALKDKSIKEMLAVLDQISSFYYFTTIEDKRASLITDFTTLTSHPYKMYENAEEAIKNARNELEQNELLIITGSLHFISEARKLLTR
ncbi:MAG: hypothetical protein K2O22_04855 [Anaeroplasmataceae bacterium]|nr:hypothetical protein [Anaeroplasmataceae bacterium]